MYNKRFCKNPENIENYQKAAADNFKGWDCHHRLETHTSDGERRLVDITKKELIALNMYYNRPAEELIFLTSLEHIRLHHKGKSRTEESKKKMREAKKGKYIGEDNPFYGKTHSEETRMRLSAAHKGKRLSKEHINKVAEANRGKHWFNNGKENKFCFECPDGFTPGRLR